MSDQAIPTPKPVRGYYHDRFWEFVGRGDLHLQKCCHCGTFRYPPGPACAECLDLSFDWEPISGRATILSFVTFHRQYLPAYPAPYQVIAVRLEEGPIMVSNLTELMTNEPLRDRSVTLVYAKMPDGQVLPRFSLDPIDASVSDQSVEA